jgi:hypothetical protein
MNGNRLQVSLAVEFRDPHAPDEILVVLVSVGVPGTPNTIIDGFRGRCARGFQRGGDEFLATLERKSRRVAVDTLAGALFVETAMRVSYGNPEYARRSSDPPPTLLGVPYTRMLSGRSSPP